MVALYCSVMKMKQEEQHRGVGRPRKSSTIKQRTLHVYLPDMEMVKEWKSLAKEHDQSISKFVIERVEDSLQLNGEGSRHTRKELIDRLFELESEIRVLKSEHEMKSRAYSALENELQILRVQPFLTPMAESMRQINIGLIDLFRTRDRINYDEILPALGIKPTDSELVKGINNQIETLVHYGLVKSDLKGWRWIE